MDLIPSMYIRNRRGPTTEPCGTPDSTGRASDELPFLPPHVASFLRGNCEFILQADYRLTNSLAFLEGHGEEPNRIMLS